MKVPGLKIEISWDSENDSFHGIMSYTGWGDALQSEIMEVEAKTVGTLFYKIAELFHDGSKTFDIGKIFSYITVNLGDKERELWCECVTCMQGSHEGMKYWATKVIELAVTSFRIGRYFERFYGYEHVREECGHQSQE